MILSLDNCPAVNEGKREKKRNWSIHRGWSSNVELFSYRIVKMPPSGLSRLTSDPSQRRRAGR